MRCAKCSSFIPEGAKICDSCGAIVESPSSLKISDRLRAGSNNSAGRRPTQSASNPGTLKIGARLRVLAQQNEEESQEPNPFSFSKPASTNKPTATISASYSEENPFSIKEPGASAPKLPKRDPVPEAPAPQEAISEEKPLFSVPALEPQVEHSIFLPVASPFGLPAEVVSESPFETPSALSLRAISRPPEAPAPVREEIPAMESVEVSSLQSPFVVSAPIIHEPLIEELVPELSPVEVAPEALGVEPSNVEVAPEAAPKVEAREPSKPTLPVVPPGGVAPPALPPVPSAEKKKDLRSLIRERTQKPDAPAPVAAPEEKPASPFKPPPPMSPKPPPLIQAKPKAGLQAPPAPKIGEVKPPLAKPSEIKPPAPPTAMKPPSPPAPVKPPAPPAVKTAAPAKAISESIELDDFMAELEEEVSKPAEREPPPLDELEAISSSIEEFSDKLEAIQPQHEPPPFRPESPPAPLKAPEVKPSEEPDEFAVALGALEVNPEGAEPNPFGRSPSPADLQLSENTLLALSLDKASTSVDDLFGNLVQPSAPKVAVASPVMPQPPQAVVSTSIELGDEDVAVDKDNPFGVGEDSVVINSQEGVAMSTLAERAASYRKSERWRELVDVLREIASRTKEPFQLLVEIGDLQWDKLQDKAQSISTHQKAMGIDAKNEKLLEKLLGHCFEAGRWEEGFELIERLGVLATSPSARARRFFDAALVLHQKYQQSEIALDLFNESLDIDPQLLESFEQIDRMLTKQRNWSALEQNYRRMIMRVSETQRPLLVMLWHNLGEIYRTRLGQMRQAAEAFEEASRLDPTNPTRQRILAELYAADPSQWERTAEHERLLFATGAARERSLHNLFKIYSGANQRDRAFRVSSILVNMGVSTPEEDTLHSQGLAMTPRAPTLPITDNMFQRLIAPKTEDSSLTTIFRLICPYAAPLYARTEKELGLNKKERVELSSGKYPILRPLQAALRQLQLPIPALYANTAPGPDEPPNTGLDIEPLLIDKSFVPGLVAGASALSPRRESELVFLLARHLVYLRPEYLLIRVCRVNQGLLKLILRAAIYLVNNTIPLPKDEEEEILQIAKQLSRSIPQSILSQVKITVEDAIAGGNDFSTTRWMAQVEHAATRAAFVLCGDLESASRVLQFDTTPLSVLSAKTKLQELHLYMLSEEYSVLRDELKIVWPAGR